MIRDPSDGSVKEKINVDVKGGLLPVTGKNSL